MFVGFKEEPGLDRLILTIDGRSVLAMEPLWTSEATPSMVNEAGADMLMSLVILATTDSPKAGNVTSEAQLEFIEKCAARLLSVADRARRRRADAIESLTKLRDELG
jgi:hypothetical protein